MKLDMMDKATIVDIQKLDGTGFMSHMYAAMAEFEMLNGVPRLKRFTLVAPDYAKYTANNRLNDD